MLNDLAKLWLRVMLNDSECETVADYSFYAEAASKMGMDKVLELVIEAEEESEMNELQLENVAHVRAHWHEAKEYMAGLFGFC